MDPILIIRILIQELEEDRTHNPLEEVSMVVVVFSSRTMVVVVVVMENNPGILIIVPNVSCVERSVM